MSDAYLMWLCKIAAKARTSPRKLDRRELERVARAHNVDPTELVEYAHAKGWVA